MQRLERAVDVHEDTGDCRAEQHQRRDDDNSDQRDDERVLYQALTTISAFYKFSHAIPSEAELTA